MLGFGRRFEQVLPHPLQMIAAAAVDLLLQQMQEIKQTLIHVVGFVTAVIP